MDSTTTLVSPRAADRSPAVQLAIELGLATAVAAATVVCAHIRLPLPFTPVPVTMQTFLVLVAGGLLGARLGTISQLEYLLAGVLGLPVLAGPTLLGPTGGYVLGFVLAAAVMGLCARRGGSAWLIIGVLAATLVIYTCGAAWLCLYSGKSLTVALTIGVAPFLAGDALKAAAAVAVIRLGRKQLARLL